MSEVDVLIVGAGPTGLVLALWLIRPGVGVRIIDMNSGKAGRIRGGDRLPWMRWNGIDNYAPLSAISWQVHIYGSATSDLRGWCKARGLPLHVYDWHIQNMGKRGWLATLFIFFGPTPMSPSPIPQLHSPHFRTTIAKPFEVSLPRSATIVVFRSIK